MMHRKVPFGLILGALASPASATLLINEPFNYSGVGLELSTAGNGGPAGWMKVTSGTTAEPIIASPGLSFSGVTSTGNKISGSSPGNATVLASSARNLPGQPWTRAENATMYYSVLLNVTDINSVPSDQGLTNSADGAFIAGFRRNTGNSALASNEGGATLLLRQTAIDSGLFQLGIGLTNNTGADRAFDTATTYTTATGTLLLVASYQFVSGGNDVVKLWVNPTPGQSEALNSSALKVTKTSPDFHGLGNAQTAAESTTSRIAGFFFRNNGSAPDAWEADELRISTNWDDLWTTAVPGIWQGGAGNWDTASNWSGGIIPNAASVPVEIDFGNALASVVTLNQDAAARSLTLNTSDTLNIDSGRTLTVATTATVNGVINNSGNLTAPTLSLSGSTAEFHWNAGTMTVNNLQMNSGAKGFMAPGANEVLKIGNSSAVSVSGVAKLDVADNKVIVTSGDLGSWNGTSYTGITRLIQFGRNGGNWNGGGLITSMTDAATKLTTLAVALAGDVGYGGTKTFGGQTVNAADVLVMYTYTGDADLSGAIDGDDFAAIDAGYSGSMTGYWHGDLDYSGLIDADDYWLIDANYGRQGAPLPAAAPVAGMSAVPEPGGIAMLGVAAIARLRRRRKH